MSSNVFALLEESNIKKARKEERKREKEREKKAQELEEKAQAEPQISAEELEKAIFSQQPNISNWADEDEEEEEEELAQQQQASASQQQSAEPDEPGWSKVCYLFQSTHCPPSCLPHSAALEAHTPI
jgi:hypothetical protein